MEALFSPNWKESLVDENYTLLDILKSLSLSGLLVACFTDEKGKLKGILTDSDIRKALISGKKMSDKAYPLANLHPKISDYRASPAYLKEYASLTQVQELLLVDDEGRLKDIFIVSLREERVQELSSKPQAEIPNAMFILAGGLGSRLSTLVNDRPKPLAPVGSQPILATVIEQGVLAGIRNFYISVNYMADQIKNFLDSDSYKHLNIKIIHEPSKMGTAGSLSLIPDKLKHPLLVCNADILTTARLDNLIKLHKQESSHLTCAIRPHFVPIPYGVFQVDQGCIKDIKEKPEETYLVNAGIYVMEPSVLQWVPPNSYFDMPDLIKLSLHKGFKVTPYYLHEYWIDIGKPDDYVKANMEFENNFQRRLLPV